MFSTGILIFNFIYICLGIYILTINPIYKHNFVYYPVCISLILFCANFFLFGYKINIGEIIIPQAGGYKIIITHFADYIAMIIGFVMGALYLRFLFQKEYMVKAIDKELD